MQITFKELQSAVIEICIQILQNEEMKQLVEKAKNIDELFGILNNNSLTISQKQIKSYKLLITNNIKGNPNYGPITKKVFEGIVNSDISPKEMIQKYYEYRAINDIRY